MNNNWDLGEFTRSGHLPTTVGHIHDRDGFSRRSSSIRVLDLALKVPGQPRAIPPEIEQFLEVINLGLQNELMSGRDVEHVYITVDQKIVSPFTTQRRPGWHSDGFIVGPEGGWLDVLPEHLRYVKFDEPIEHTYVAYDTLPTLFADGPWDIGDPRDCEAVLASFDEQAQEKKWWRFVAYSVLHMTPYCVHACQLNQDGLLLPRTFVKVQFSTHRYNREENTRNPMIDYAGWEWVGRDPSKREHRYA